MAELQETGFELIAPPALRPAVMPFVAAAVEYAGGQVPLAAALEHEQTVREALGELRVLVKHGVVRIPKRPKPPEDWRRGLADNADTIVRMFRDGLPGRPPKTANEDHQEASSSTTADSTAGANLQPGCSASAAEPVLLDEYGPLPFRLVEAANLEDPDPTRFWLIDQIWQRAGTGILGGPAKGAKTWLSLDIALSVASGTPCLDTFAVHDPGPVLVKCAEGGQGYIKQRLIGLCARRGLQLNDVSSRLKFIEDPIRLDLPESRDRLMATLKAVRPRLLILDPLVRLHRIDENSAGQVSQLLGFLSEVQERNGCAVLVVHHATKSGRADVRGQDLRGSGDFYAWGDSNLFLGRRGERFVLRAEHRAARAPKKCILEAVDDENAPYLVLVEDEKETGTDPGSSAGNKNLELRAKVLAKLRETGRTTVAALRAGVGGRHQDTTDMIQQLVDEGMIVRANRRLVLNESACPGDAEDVHQPAPGDSTASGCSVPVPDGT